ncbi:MAG: Holliday junction resolvase RuvX [Mycoplasmataceae bacterium]|nr:Holliday junction resolvase RuvX [Mycoplasmataceae bacterium]
MARIIALDLGTKKCGIAMTDPLKIISQGLEIIYYDAQDFDKIIFRIEEIIKKYGEVETFILGNPLMLSGDLSNMSKIVIKFKDKLVNHFKINTILVDERYSSKESTNIMINMNMSRSKQKKNRDKLAAQIILENFLRYQK